MPSLPPLQSGFAKLVLTVSPDVTVIVTSAVAVPGHSGFPPVTVTVYVVLLVGHA